MVEILNGGIVKITDAHIMMRTRNFAGEEKKNQNGRVVNNKGSRNFCVFIDDADVAQRLTDEGWNIHALMPQDDGGEVSYYVSVAVGYKVAAPKIVMISGDSHSELTENTVGSLDYADIEKVDMAIRPRRWVDDRNGNIERIKAYLKTMYVTLKQDEFAGKYNFDDPTPESTEEEMPW